MSVYQSTATNTAITLACTVLPTIMLGKLFQPVRYYLRLSTFLLGLGQSSRLGIPHSGMTANPAPAVWQLHRRRLGL